jgi:SAM-dependent methyltransferase
MEPNDVADAWEANADAWTRHSRAGYDIYRDALNTPVFIASLPNVGGAKGLDIGCGEGSNTRQVARLGAQMNAVDIAPTFIRHAQETEGRDPMGITYLVANAEQLPFANATFDFTTAFMSLMDVRNQSIALREACRVLRPGGFLQFSILHPCFVSPYRKNLKDETGRRIAVQNAGYFDNIDGRIDTFWFEALPVELRGNDGPFNIPRFHRTLSQWVDMIITAGFMVEKFVEPSASQELAEKEPVVADTRIAPMSLIVRARKPA